METEFFGKKELQDNTIFTVRSDRAVALGPNRRPHLTLANQRPYPQQRWRPPHSEAAGCSGRPWRCGAPRSTPWSHHRWRRAAPAPYSRAGSRRAPPGRGRAERRAPPPRRQRGSISLHCSGERSQIGLCGTS